MTTYTILDRGFMAAGIVTVKLHSELSGLTVPSVSTLIANSDFVERVDIASLGHAELEDVTFEYREDYTTYEEGFWFKVLQKQTAIQITLDDDQGEKHFFFGYVIPEGVNLAESSLVPTAYQREGSFRCLSGIYAFANVTIGQLATELASHIESRHDGAPTEYDFVSFKAVFASMLSLAFSQSYDIADVEVEGNDFYMGGVSVIGGLETFLTKDFSTWYMYFDSVSGSQRHYLVSGEDGSFQERYASCLELLASLTKNFGFIPRHYYDVDNSKHKLQLIARASSYQSLVTVEMPFESFLHKKSDVFAQNITSTRSQTQNAPSFEQDGVVTAVAENNHYVIGGGSLAAGDISEPLTADMSLAVDFWTASTIDAGNGLDMIKRTTREMIYYLLTDNNDNDIRIFNAVIYWDRKKDGYDSSFGQDYFTEAMCRYLQSLMSDRSEYERTYNTLQMSNGSTTTFSHSTIWKRTLISDGRENLVIEDCEDAWTAGSVHVTASLDTGDYQVGSGSAKFECGAGVAALDVIGSESITATDLSAYAGVYLWIKSEVAAEHGDLQLQFFESATLKGTSNIPALSAATWTRVYCRLEDAKVLTAVDSLKLIANTDLGAGDVWLDDIQATTDREFRAMEIRKNLTTAQMYIRWIES